MFLATVLLCTSACARSHQVSKPPTPTEQIQAVLCAIDQKSYEAAEKTLEQLLASDPKNANYQKALLGVQGRQVKRDDHSAQNVVLIKKVIEGYNQALKNLQLTTDERRWVDSSLLFLYEQLGEEDVKKELLKRAADTQRAGKDRTEAYVMLATRSWDCAFRITSANSSPDKAAIERAQTCTNDGLDYVNKALALEPDNESAWSYKTNLLHEALALAGLRNEEAQKVTYQNQYNEALKHTQEVLAKVQAQRAEENRQSEETSKKAAAAEQDTRDFTEFHLENSFDKVASDLLLSRPFDFTPLVEPGDGAKVDRQPVRLATPGSTPEQKSDWKTFSANDDLIMDLPDNVRQTTAGGYTAASAGVIYSVIPVPRPAVQTELQVVNGILNTLARSQAQFFSRAWLSSGLGNRYELKLIRSEDAGGEPRKIYAYSLISCGERKDGVMIVQASQTHYYTIDINGAGESDPRAQRLLTSIKVK